MRSLFLFLAFGASVFAQNKTTPDCDVPFTFTVATERSQFGGCAQNLQGVWEWRVVYFVDGFTAVSVELQDAPDSAGAPGTWVTWAGTITTGYSNPSSATPQGSISATGYFPWASVTLISKMGTGSVTGHLYGCREPGCSIAGPGGGGGGRGLELHFGLTLPGYRRNGGRQRGRRTSRTDRNGRHCRKYRKPAIRHQRPNSAWFAGRAYSDHPYDFRPHPDNHAQCQSDDHGFQLLHFVRIVREFSARIRNDDDDRV